MNQTIRYSDQIVALSNRGRIVAQGSPREVVTTEMLKEVYGVELDVVSYQDTKVVMNF